MPDREQPQSLWAIWWNAILVLRPAFSRLRTFMWFVTAVAGLTVRLELLGVTSIVRALNLRPRLYLPMMSSTRSGPSWPVFVGAAARGPGIRVCRKGAGIRAAFDFHDVFRRCAGTPRT